MTLSGDSDSPMYLGPDGSPLDQDEWAELFGRRTDDMSPESWWRKETRIGERLRVSTVWLGLNHSMFPGSPPLYWETMIFAPGRELERDQWRYSSREAALDDHERIVGELRAGREPE